MIGIIDYDAGNIQNLQNALKLLKIASMLISSPDDLENVDKLILPGVGAFGPMMTYLQEMQMVKPIKEWISDGKQFLGICLGYQALFETSQETNGINGLNVLSGKVCRFREGKVPQIGWNNTKIAKSSSVFNDSFYYFVHSYHPVPKEEDVIATITNYHDDFASGIEVNNIYATQFHPERSGKEGLAFLRRWSRR